MLSRSACLALLLACPGVATAGAARADPAPTVVASIKPVHALVAGVMADVGAPELLIEGAGSPHSYALRPSQARLLDQAEVVFWVGEGLEAFLARPLAALTGDAAVVALGDAKGLRLLPARQGGARTQEAREQEEVHAHDAVDLHLWLDPGNAAAMVGAIAAALGAADPERAALYQANAEQVRADLGQLDEELSAALAPVRGRPFVVFHDAYQYFEERYRLNAVGAIAVDPQRPPGAARVRQIRAELQARDAACVFAEPQFRPALVETVVEGTGAGTGVLDPLGAGLAAGPDQYAQLMRALARSLLDCLGAPRPG